MFLAKTKTLINCAVTAWPMDGTFMEIKVFVFGICFRYRNSS